MRTKIISGFPGMGKTHYMTNNPGMTLDSDSSNFSWVKNDRGNNTRIRSPDFPGNYIRHIQENVGKAKYIFVSSHKQVRDAMLDHCLFFYLVYPAWDQKQEYLDRYRERGSPESFIQLVDQNWGSWLEEIWDEQEKGMIKIEHRGTLTSLIKNYNLLKTD